jgi:hypothetical protein
MHGLSRSCHTSYYSEIEADNAMITVHEEYLVDDAGNRKAVVLSLAEWQQI